MTITKHTWMNLREVNLETDARDRPAVGTVSEDCYAVLDGGARVVCYVPLSAGYPVAQEIVRVLRSGAEEVGL